MLLMISHYSGAYSNYNTYRQRDQCHFFSRIVAEKTGWFWTASLRFSSCDIL